MIDTSDLEIIYNGEAGQEEFGITFPYASSDDIKVYIADSDVPLAASEYSITNNKVVLSTPLEETATVRITRNTPLTQETQYINQGTTDLTRIEHSFDKLTMIAQENHNSMASVDSRVNSNMSSIAASTAAIVESATAVYRNEASGYATSAASAETNASAWANSASAAASAAGQVYVAGSGMAITEIISGGSNYKQIRTLVDGSTINYTSNGYLSAIPPERIVSASAANPLSASVSDKTLNLDFKYDNHFGIDSNGNFTLLSGGSAGNGIIISGDTVAAKVDSTTIGFDSNGALSCSVSGSAIPYVGSNGIDVNGTVISAKLDGSTISTNASGELQCLVSGGGQTYTAGDGIVISDGAIKIANTALQDVPQVISSGYIARTSNSTGVFLSGTTVRIFNSGKAHYSATLNVATLYGASTDVALQCGSNFVTIKNSDDSGFNRIVHAGMSATPDDPGIVQPDNSTCTVESGGILHCTGGGGGGIDTVSTFGGINAAINGNVLSLGAGEDFLETAEQNTSGFFNDSSRIAHLGFTSSGIRMGASYNDYDSGSAAAGINAEFNSSSLSPEIRIDVRNSSSGSYDNSTIIHGGGISTGIIKQGGGYTSSCQFYADDIRFGYYTTFHREGYWDAGSAYFKLTKSNFSMCVPYESGNYDDKTGMHIYLTRQDGGIGFGGGDTEGVIDYGVCFTTGGGDVPNGGLVFKTRGHNITMQGSGGRAMLDNADMLTVQNFPQLISVASPLSCSANDSSGVLALNYDSTVMSTTGAGALTLVSTPSDAVVSNFDSGGEFSRVHAGGFCVQGGHYEPIYTSNGNAEVIISLHTPFRDTNYVVNQQPQRYIGASSSIHTQHLVYSKTTSSFIIYAGQAQELLDNLYFDGGGDWVAMGFVS